MPPRRKAERDVSETDGTDGRHRRMSLRRKPRTDGPSVLKCFRLRDIRLCHSSGPSQSRRQTSPRRMPLRRMPPRRMEPRRMPPETDGAETDAPETDGAETDAPETDLPKTDGAETDGPETDVPETEEGGDGGRPRWMSPRRKVCFSKDCGRLLVGVTL